MPQQRPPVPSLPRRADRARVVLTFLLAPALAACGSATAPQKGGTPPPPLTHPAGVIAAIDTLAGTPFGVAISTKGAVVATMAGSDVLRLGSLTGMAFTDSVVVGPAPLGVVTDRAGATAYSALEYDNGVAVVDLARNTREQTISLTSNGIAVSLAPDGSRLYATTAAGTLFVIDAITDLVLDTIAVGPAADGLAFNADGSTLYVSSRDSGTVTAIDPGTDAIVRTYAVGGKPQRIVVSPDGRTVYAANEVSTLDVLDVRTGTVTHLDAGAAAYGLGLTPDGTQLYLLLPNLGEAWVIDRATLQVKDTLVIGGVPRDVAFDPTGAVAAITNEQSVTFVR